MKYYVVFDTNVLVSSLITKNLEAPTVKVVDMIADGVLTPVFNQDILDEYTDVLHRISPSTAVTAATSSG